MANHKRRRPKHQRAGCLLCKPWKDERIGARANSQGSRSHMLALEPVPRASAVQLEAEAEALVEAMEAAAYGPPIPDEPEVFDLDEPQPLRVPLLALARVR